VSQFEVITASTTVKAKEAIDVTVRAVDKDGKTVKTYRGSIAFATDRFGDVVPFAGKAIQFGPEDSGEKKFSKGVIFQSPGKGMITVIDLDDDITGEASITVEPASATGTPSVSAETVTIITPETGTKITADVVLVSGKARKNSKVQFTLNGQDAGTAVTDDLGVFTKSLSNITQKSNILSVGLVDAANTVLAKSSDISFEKVIATSNFYNLVMSPSNIVEVSAPVTLTVEAEPNMSSVTLGLD
jgi:hypothetical protein